MAKSHLKTKTRSSRPNPSRIKASTAPESPKQAAKRTISARNTCTIWASERGCRALGRGCRAYGEGSPPQTVFDVSPVFFGYTISLKSRLSAILLWYFGPHLELNEEDNARSVASPCSESCLIPEQHSQSREKIRGARGTQAFAAHGMIDDPRNHGRTEHPRSCERSILPRGPAAPVACTRPY